MSQHCPLCGAASDSRRMIAGKTGYVACLRCLAPAFHAVAQTCDQARSPLDIQAPSLTAADRCYLCDNTIPSVKLVAHHGPYRFCNDCLLLALEASMDDGDGRLAVVEF